MTDISQKQGGWTPGQERWEVSCAQDPRGYPAFYINGLSGDQKRDGNRLESFRLLIAAAPDLYAAAQKLMQSIQEMDPEQRGCSTVAYAEMWEALERANPSTDQGGE